MAKFSPAFIGRVRDAADIVQIIGHHVPLKKSGASMVGKCPFCADTSENLSIHVGKRVFKCWLCEEKGDVFAFLRKKTGQSFGEVVKSVANDLGIPIEYETEYRPPAAKAAATSEYLGSADEEAERMAALEKVADAEPEAFTPPDGSESAPPPPESPQPAEPVAEVTKSAETKEKVMGPELVDEALNAIAAEEEAAPSEQSLSALREFCDEITLTEESIQLHWQKRGLKRETLIDFGIKSGSRGYVDIILRLGNKYPSHAMINCGLKIQREGEGVRPSPKFYGYGIAGKKPKAERRGKDDKFNYGWVYPPLIPYLGEDRKIYFLRPHKDQVAGTTNRFYIPRVLPRLKIGDSKDPATLHVADEEETFHQAVITEGELKSLALQQVVGDPGLGDSRWAVAALPGITNAKPMFSDIIDWLDSIEAKSVVVVYDNEEKGNPKFPGYVENDWERHDAEGWARYLAIQLQKEGFTASVGHLPNEWRDDKGKADWDGALVKLLRQYTLTDPDKPLPDEKDISPDVWKKVRADFLRVLKDARPAGMLRQFGLFDPIAERHIQNLVQRISRTPQLPIGGLNEESVAKRIQRFLKKCRNDIKRVPYDRRAALGALAKKYQELQGRYYVLKELGDRAAPKWEKELAKADENEDVEYKRVIEIAKRGIPQWISNFYIKAHYCLNKIDGKRERLITIRNIHKKGHHEGPVLTLPSDAFAQPSKWREWLLNADAAATWRAGERELNDLQADVGSDVAFKDVAEISYRGYNDETGFWFFDDVAFLQDGSEIYPDKETGIFWHHGFKESKDGQSKQPFSQGYKLSKVGNAKQPFRMGFPKMYPKRIDPNLSEMFTEVSKKFVETVGWAIEDSIGYDGFVCLGIAFSCFAGPELYDHYVGMPGLWLHGESQQGKNCLTRWILPIHGYEKKAVKSGIVLPGSTEAGLGHALEQEGNLFCWLEEYQPEMARTKPWLVEKIKNAFDRSSGTKMVFGDEMRQIRSVALVNGIATASDSQVKNRYAHVQVSEKFRRANHYDWFEENSPDFFFFGRHILRNRAAFAKSFMAHMVDWFSSDSTKGIDSRAKIVYGAAYAGMRAAAEIFKSDEIIANMPVYKTWVARKARVAASEIREKINANQFWTDLMSAVETGAFGFSAADLKRYFKAVPMNLPTPVPESQQTEEFAGCKWKSYYLYITERPVIEIMRTFKARSHSTLPLEANDYFRQMQTKPYFVNAPRGKDRVRLRFKAKSPQDCWCINVDRHELGYTPVDDEELRFSITRREGERQSDGTTVPADWVDPRQGDLFTLIHKLLQADNTNP